MTCELAVVADDLTGANDTGVQFSKYGLRTIVVVDLTKLNRLLRDADVIVANTDSRHLRPAAAYEQVRVVMERLQSGGISRIYKKIDSTLRGNIGAELDAVMDVTGIKAALVMPAFPAYGRTTVDGYQLWNGLRLTETEVGADPLCPVTEAHVPTLLSRQSHRAVHHVPLEIVHSGYEALAESFRQALSEGREVIVVDAVSPDDLTLAARAATGAGLSSLMCGSAGLAQELPAALNLLRQSDRGKVGAGEHVLLVAGSLSRITEDQLATLGADPRIRLISVSTQQILKSASAREKEIRRAVAAVLGVVELGFDAAVVLDQHTEINEKTRVTADSRKIVSALAEVARAVLRKARIRGLVVTGGDTAVAVCRALGAAGVEVRDEVEPGIPFGQLIGGTWDGVDIVTKAGAFGDVKALQSAVHYLRSTKHEQHKYRQTAG